MKVPPRRGEREPGGGEAQEGNGWYRRLNPGGVTTDPGEEQALKARRRFAAQSGQPFCSEPVPTTRGYGPATSWYGFIGGEIPEAWKPGRGSGVK